MYRKLMRVQRAEYELVKSPLCFESRNEMKVEFDNTEEHNLYVKPWNEMLWHFMLSRSLKILAIRLDI